MHSKDFLVILSPPKAIAELLHVVTIPIADPFGAVASARVNVKGRLCQATLRLHDFDYVLLLGNVELYESHDSFNVISDTHYDAFRKTALHPPLYLFLTASTEIKARRWEFSDGFLDLDGKTHAGLSLVQPKTTHRYGADLYQCLVFVPAGCRGRFRRIEQTDFLKHKVPVIQRPALEAGDEANVRTVGSILDAQFSKDDVPDGLYEEIDENFLYTITLV